MMTSRRPPRLSTRPISNRIVPMINPKKVATPVTAIPARPAPTAAKASEPASAVPTTSDAARPDSRNAEIGSAKTEAPSARKPRPNARRIEGAKKQRTPQRRTRDIITIGVTLSSADVNAAKAGVSAIAEAAPKKIPIRMRKAALAMIIRESVQVDPRPTVPNWSAA